MQLESSLLFLKVLGVFEQVSFLPPACCTISLIDSQLGLYLGEKITKHAGYWTLNGIASQPRPLARSLVVKRCRQGQAGLKRSKWGQLWSMDVNLKNAVVQISGWKAINLAKIYLGTLSRVQNFSLGLSWRLGRAVTQERIQDRQGTRQNGSEVRQRWIRAQA